MENVFFPFSFHLFFSSSLKIRKEGKMYSELPLLSSVFTGHFTAEHYNSKPNLACPRPTYYPDSTVKKKK